MKETTRGSASSGRGVDFLDYTFGPNIIEWPNNAFHGLQSAGPGRPPASTAPKLNVTARKMHLSRGELEAHRSVDLALARALRFAFEGEDVAC